MLTVTTNESDDPTPSAGSSEPEAPSRVDSLLARAQEKPTDARELLGIDKPAQTLADFRKQEEAANGAPVTETPEGDAEEAPTPAAEEEAAPEDAVEAARKERLADIYNRNAKLDRELQRKKRDLRAMETRLKEREREVANESSTQWRERAKTDLAGVMKELSIDPDEWAASRVLGQPEPTTTKKESTLPPEVAEVITTLRQEVEELKADRAQRQETTNEYAVMVNVYSAMNTLAKDLPILNSRKARGEDVDKYIAGRAKALIADNYDVDYPALIKDVEDTLRKAYVADITATKDHPDIRKALSHLLGPTSKTDIPTSPKSASATEHKISSRPGTPAEWEKLIGQVVRGEVKINSNDFGDEDDSVGHIVERVKNTPA